MKRSRYLLPPLLLISCYFDDGDACLDIPHGVCDDFPHDTSNPDPPDDPGGPGGVADPCALIAGLVGAELDEISALGPESPPWLEPPFALHILQWDGVGEGVFGANWTWNSLPMAFGDRALLTTFVDDVFVEEVALNVDYGWIVAEPITPGGNAALSNNEASHVAQYVTFGDDSRLYWAPVPGDGVVHWGLHGEPHMVRGHATLGESTYVGPDLGALRPTRNQDWGWMPATGFCSVSAGVDGGTE